MKLTIILSEDLIEQVKYHSEKENIVESITVALEDLVSLQKIKVLNQEIEDEPLEFKEDFSVQKVRGINRQTK